MARNEKEESKAKRTSAIEASNNRCELKMTLQMQLNQIFLFVENVYR